MTEPGTEARPAWNLPSVGRWGVSVLPNGWMFITDFGVRQVTDSRQIAANIMLGQDILADELALPAYIEVQAGLIQRSFEAAKIAGPQLAAFQDADQAFLFMVRHRPEGVPGMLHVQTYVRSGLWLGIVTLTVVEADLQQIRSAYEGFLKGLRILPA